MKKHFPGVALFSLLVLTVFRLTAAEPRKVDMTWWQDDKFGLFIHWGLYTLDDGKMLQDKVPLQKMWEVAGTFNPTEFDAEKWVQCAVNTGMKYLVLTTKHHDGFALFHSPSNAFNLVDATPFKRDPVKELSDACDKYGIKFCVYYSLGRDLEDPDVPSNWPQVGGRSNDWDFPDENNKRFERYFQRKLKPQVIELLTQYNVRMIWFDTEGFCSPAQSQELLELAEKYRPGCLVNDRVGNGLGDFTTPEQAVLKEICREPWESCITVSAEWAYSTRDTVCKSPEIIGRLLTDIVAKGGNFLLNMAPTPWGTFQQLAVDTLAVIGRWMKTNGEAIYGTRPWRVYGEVYARETFANVTGEETFDSLRDETAKGTEPDIRFTAKPGVLYVIARSWREASVRVDDLLLSPHEQIARVSLLGWPGKIGFTRNGNGITMERPEKYAPEVPLYVYKLELKDE